MSTIEKKLRKTLLEKKEEKNRMIQEQRVFEKKLKPIFENAFSNENFIIDLIREYNDLKIQGLINEQNQPGFWDMIKSWFGVGLGDSLAEYAKEQLVQRIFQAMGVQTGTWTSDFVKVFFANIDFKDFDKLFDCKYMVDKFSESLAETTILRLQKAGGGITDNALTSIVRQAFVDYLDKSVLAEKMKGGIKDILCPLLQTSSEKLAQKATEMKKGAVQGAVA